MIANWLKTYGFKQSKVDTCIYVFNKNNIVCFLGLYVDDLPGGCNDKKFLDQMKNDINRVYTVIDMGIITRILGVQIEHSKGDMHLHQEDYIKQIVLKASVERHYEQPIPL
jgi:hypothetical protein